MKRQLLSKLAVIASGVFLMVSFVNCGGSNFNGLVGNQTTSIAPGPIGTLPAVSGANVLPITIGCGYVNEPCVSVTICTPGTSKCQTIPNVLVDTGSYGLRLFKSVVTATLPAKTNAAGKTLAECVSYADGSSQWGPLALADVTLGQETASNVPIEIIDSKFLTPPSDCIDVATDPATSGFNGILGVGLLKEDCGADCVADANNRIYFACSSTACSSSTILLTDQVTNPVALMPTDNNGVVLSLANIVNMGAASANGYLILGIGTQTNNVPTAKLNLPTDTYGDISTTFAGKTYSTAFIDSGSNGLYFPSSTLTACSSTGNFAGFYCPAADASLSATMIGYPSGPSAVASFSVTDASRALASSNPNMAFNNLAGSATSAFDWGLPFFYGRSIYFGLSGAKSTLGTGPYVAY